MPTGRWMQAVFWRDNKFVKLLSTVYVGAGVKKEVKRWDKQSHARRKVVVIVFALTHTTLIHPHNNHPM